MNVSPGEGTYCAFIQPLVPLREEIVETAKTLNNIKDLAVLKQGDGFYVVMNFTNDKLLDNLRRDVPKHFEAIGVFTMKKLEGHEVKGIFRWLRNFHELLRDKLCGPPHAPKVLQDGEIVYPIHPLPPADVHVTKLKQISDEEKLDILNNVDEWPDDLDDDLADAKCIEDFIPFSKAFEKLFGYYKEDKTLQLECVKMFGKWAPSVRSKHTGPKNEYLDQPVTHMKQIPPSIREKLSPRMQCKGPHLCPECGSPRNEASRYCSEKHEQVNNKLVCPCGSTNVQEKRHKFTFETNEEMPNPPEGSPGVYTARRKDSTEPASETRSEGDKHRWDDVFWFGATGRDEKAAQKRDEPEPKRRRIEERSWSEQVCMDCKKVLVYDRVSFHSVENAGKPYERRANDDHVPEWTKRKRC
jgi:hypothetical protein